MLVTYEEVGWTPPILYRRVQSCTSMSHSSSKALRRFIDFQCIGKTTVAIKNLLNVKYVLLYSFMSKQNSAAAIYLKFYNENGWMVMSKGILRHCVCIFMCQLESKSNNWNKYNIMTQKILNIIIKCIKYKIIKELNYLQDLTMTT